jgi:hypothetical protein
MAADDGGGFGVEETLGEHRSDGAGGDGDVGAAEALGGLDPDDGLRTME